MPPEDVVDFLRCESLEPILQTFQLHRLTERRYLLGLIVESNQQLNCFFIEQESGKLQILFQCYLYWPESL